MMAKTETVCRFNRIQVLSPEKCSEVPDAEMKIIGYIRPVTDLNTILVKEFSNGW